MRTDGPVTFEGVDIGFGNATLQMTRDVLKVFMRLAVDVAREVEVELVLLDLLEAHHASVFLDFEPLGEDIDDLVNVLGAEAVLGAILHKACAGIDHEDALAGVGALLVDDDDAGGDASAIEEVRGQADDALDVALADEIAPDIAFNIAPEQYAMREDARAFSRALERADDVQKVGVVALLSGWRAKMLEAFEGITAYIC
jgi:hypothetical protein